MSSRILTASQGQRGGYFRAYGSIANAAVKTLHSVPVKIVNAPPVATGIWLVTKLVCEGLYVTPTFTGGGSIFVAYGATQNAASGFIAANLLTGPVVDSLCGASGNIVNVLTDANAFGLSLYLTCASADFATGNGSLNWYLEYELVTTFKGS